MKTMSNSAQKVRCREKRYNVHSKSKSQYQVQVEITDQYVYMTVIIQEGYIIRDKTYYG